MIKETNVFANLTYFVLTLTVANKKKTVKVYLKKSEAYGPFLVLWIMDD